MNTEEIKSIAALCYLEQAWTEIPRAKQTIALCEMFLARLAEQAEPVGFSDCFGNLRNQRELDRLRDKGDARYKTYDIPLYTQPITKPAPQEGTTHPAELPARETPVGAAHIPEPAPQQQNSKSESGEERQPSHCDGESSCKPAVGAAHDPFAPPFGDTGHIPLPLASTPSLPKDVQETLNDLRLYAKMGTNPIAQELTLRSYDMLERLAEQSAKWQALAEAQATLAEVVERRLAKNAAEWKHIAEDNMADYNEYKAEVRARASIPLPEDVRKMVERLHLWDATFGDGYSAADMLERLAARAAIRNEVTDEQLTTIYNTANGIGEGKAPPITTQRIFCAMRAMIAAGEKK